MLGMLRNKVTLGLGLALLLASGGVFAMTKLYLGKRDELAAQVVQTGIQTARADSYYAELEKQAELQKKSDQVRLDLQARVTELENQEVKTITEIREVWRDREVIIENPVAVECAGEPVPGPVLGLLCEASGVYAGACADLQPDPGGPALEMPSARLDGRYLRGHRRVQHFVDWITQ